MFFWSGTQQYTSIPPVPVESTKELTTDELKTLARTKAVQAGLDPDQVYKTIDCETAGTWNPKIQSEYVKNGVREDSWGLAQIYLPAWPSVSKDEATDGVFAIDFLIDKWVHGERNKWTCYRLLAANDWKNPF